MKVRHLLVGLSTLVGGLFAANPTSATTYSHEATVQFTFNSEISVVIDTADIEILDLAPGTSSDSNVVGLTISTNNVVGYTASATVGNATYNTTSMIHTNGTNAFTSIAENASEASLSTDNTWGYTTSLDNGSSWANLSGLPIYTDTAKEIAATNSPASDAIKFKINAKASTSQAAGDYKNVINFTVVANVPPRTMEDVLNEDPNTPRDPETGFFAIQSINDSICEATEAINSPIIATDIRDHKNYRVVKLKDGNCWMQDNLALDLTMANASSKITSSNTNANSTALNALFGVANRDASTDPNGNLAVAGIAPYVANDYASDRPMIYTEAQDDTNDQDEIASVQNSKFGIYYNSCAASAGSYCYTSGLDDNADKTDTAVDIEYDVCPSNWRLPTSEWYYGGWNASPDADVDAGEFDKLYDYYYQSHGTDLRADWLLPKAGYFVFPTNDLQNVGDLGNYWSSTIAYRGLYVDGGGNDDYMNTRNNNQPVFGYNIRCIVKTSKIAIVFDKNEGYGDMPSQVTKHGHTVKLDRNQYARWDYVFNGWNTKADGTGMGYKDGDTFTATTDSSITKFKLYAQWVEDTGQGSGNVGKTLQDAYEMAYVTNPGQFQKDGGGTKHGLYVPHKTNGVYDGTYFEATQQSDYEGIPAKDLRFAIQDIDMTIDGVKVCDYATVIGSEAYVLDLRDNKSYWVAKLADGKCWMTQNLDLNLSQNTALTSEKSDVSESWTPARDTISFDGASTTSMTGWTNHWNSPYSADPGNLYIVSSGSSNLDTVYNSLSACKTGTNLDDECSHYHLGNFYNWNAAIARNDYSTNTNNYSVAPDSVCPAGWRLPKGPTSGDEIESTASEWNQLLVKYNIINGYLNSDMAYETDGLNIIRDAPLYLIRTGDVDEGVMSGHTQYFGSYWTGSSYAWNQSYHLMLTNGGSVPNDHYGRYKGYAIRCVAR